MNPYANCDYDVFVDAYHGGFCVDIFDPVSGETVKELDGIHSEQAAEGIAEGIIAGLID